MSAGIRSAAPLVAVAAILASCSAADEPPSTPAAVPVPSITAPPTSSATPSRTSRPSPLSLWASPTSCPPSEWPTGPSIPPLPFPLASPTPYPVPESPMVPSISPPAGLLFCDHGLWLVREDGSDIEIAPSCQVHFSPDMAYALLLNYDGIRVVDLTRGVTLGLADEEEGPPHRAPCGWSRGGDAVYYLESGEDWWNEDIWRYALGTGEARNITNTPTRDEGCPFPWFPEGYVLFGSQPSEDALRPFGAGVPTVGTDEGEGYRVLGIDAEMGLAQLSPTGDAVALLGGYVLSSAGGLRALDAGSASGQEPRVGLSAPSWSPDGTHIAWSTNGFWIEGSPTAVYDTRTWEMRLLHPYNLVMGEGFPPEPGWSPDSRWLTLITYESWEGPPGLWIFAADGSEEHLLGTGEFPVWSPDSTQFAVTVHDPVTWMSHVDLFEVGSWQASRVDLPDGSWVVDWLDPVPVRHWSGMHEIRAGPTFVVTPAGHGQRMYDDRSAASGIVSILHVGDVITMLWYEPLPGDGLLWWYSENLTTGEEGWVIENTEWYARTHDDPRGPMP